MRFLGAFILLFMLTFFNHLNIWILNRFFPIQLQIVYMCNLTVSCLNTVNKDEDFQLESM